VTDFSSLVTAGNPGNTKATFAAPLEWNLGGLGLREIRKNGANEYLAIAGTSDDSNSTFGLYTWDGIAADQPVLSATPLAAVAEGAWEDIVSVPEPLVDGSTVELLEDNGDSVWYEDGLTSKSGMPSGLQKDLGRVFTLALPTPAAPSAPHLAAGANPNMGEFTLAWEAQAAAGQTYTLQHEDTGGTWSTLASGLSSPEYAFTAGSPEGEGTWTYRVTAASNEPTTEPSAESEAIKVDESAPSALSVAADRAPDYAGGGGWYKDSVTVSFTENGDPLLADGSAGSGVNPASIPAPQLFSADGPHAVSATAVDNAGNSASAVGLSVQLDASAPSVEVACQSTAQVGEAGVNDTVTAADGQSGLAVDPSGTVPIDTSKAGTHTIERVAVDNVGHSSSASCTTVVANTLVISGSPKKKVVVKSGEAVEFAPGAKVKAVEVLAGGSLTINGASTAAIKSSGANLLRICGASISGAVKVANSTGPVTIGGEDCSASTFAKAVTIAGNKGGVLVDGATFKAPLKVTGGSGGTTVTHNTVSKNLTVTGNTGSVTDKPNTVGGKSKLQ
jgi:hypothetical protein